MNKNEDIIEFTDNPRLKDKDDVFYIGCGCTWGTDLDGKRYWKLYHLGITGDRYNHLSHGDIVNEKARIEKIISEYLSKKGIQ